MGRGRLGTALAQAFESAGIAVEDDAPVVLLAVPDAAIEEAAAFYADRIVGHTSGATPVAVLPAGGFGLHPLQTFAGGEGPETFRGVGAAIGGDTTIARPLALALGMVPFELSDSDRPTYHAAASIASNFLVTLEATAEQVGDGVITREHLVPLVRTTVENWAARGSGALTGPVARGDEDTVARQRAALPAEVLEVFDAMVERTRVVGGRSSGAGRQEMRVVRSVEELRRSLSGSVGLVPTMGALHEGHLSLIRRCAAENDTTVVSLFVNPRQFGEDEDLGGYPRDEKRDALLAEQAGADVLFAPPTEAVYPEGFASAVEVEGALTEVLCGAVRPGHFRGVTTVVAKLFNMVGPDRAYFGQKDAQQLAVIRRMARDLDFPVEVIGCPIVRDEDGLAMSSRNRYLTAEDRRAATALGRAVATGSEQEARAILDGAGIRPEYLEVFEPGDGPATLAVAARVGRARLIDNAIIGGAK
ncbi:MAG: pantoate--beta-alanine ligase [Thermoleophilaceae bacterium]|nr:pantoate--beta-alanine ligase [Thermoleophilaceae bacterium]